MGENFKPLKAVKPGNLSKDVAPNEVQILSVTSSDLFVYLCDFYFNQLFSPTIGDVNKAAL